MQENGFKQFRHITKVKSSLKDITQINMEEELT